MEKSASRLEVKLARRFPCEAGDRRVEVWILSQHNRRQFLSSSSSGVALKVFLFFHLSSHYRGSARPFSAHLLRSSQHSPLKSVANSKSSFLRTNAFLCCFKGISCKCSCGSCCVWGGIIRFRRMLRIDQNPATGPQTWPLDGESES